MPALKTQKNDNSVAAFIKAVTDEWREKDAFTILNLMEAATKANATMWGTAIIGFGERLLIYENGRALDWFMMGFSPRNN